MYVAADIVSVVLVVIATVFVVALVIGLHVWGAVQDGREEKEMRARRHPPERE